MSKDMKLTMYLLSWCASFLLFRVKFLCTYPIQSTMHCTYVIIARWWDAFYFEYLYVCLCKYIEKKNLLYFVMLM